MNDEATKLRHEIMQAISKTNDENMKMVLLFMLTFMDTIATKIDTILMDENRLTEVVLNGHAHVHHGHHEWVERRIKQDCSAYCDWAKRKQQEEAEEQKADKESARTIRDGLIQNILWALLVVVAGSGWFLK